MNRIMRYLAPAAPMLLAVGLLSLLPSCKGGPGLIQPNRTWVATEPIQCLGNPWEADWLAQPGNEYGDYPRDSASRYAIIRAYYAGLGVEVTDIISILKYDVVCLACDCPRGDALYLHVRDGDVATMLLLGYRVELPLQPQPGDTTITGVYQYTGYDSSGSPLITGTLTFQRADSTTVSGMWNLRGPTGFGPQTGVGAFEGWIDRGMITLNLNPGWADNNVFLYGELNAGVYAGRWEWSTFIGPTYTGRFMAVKR